MKYRAKITNIVDLIKESYDISKDHLVRDAKDIYIEVSDEKEAEILEKLNGKKK